MALHYLSFTSVQRHLLQVEADDEADALEKVEEVVKYGSCLGMVIYDADKPLLLHGPYGSDEFGPLEEGDGPFWYQGSAFGDEHDWLVQTAGEIAAVAMERKHDRDAT